MRAQRILIILILTVILGGLLLVYAGYRHCFTRGCTSPCRQPPNVPGLRLRAPRPGTQEAGGR